MRKAASVRFIVLGAFFVLAFGLFTQQAKADICKMVFAGTTYTPTQKPQITVGTSPVMTVFGSWVDVCTRVACSGSGVSISKGSPNWDIDGCKTSIVLTFTSISSTATLGDRTITIYGSVAGNETVTGSFKITLIPAYCNTVEGIVNMMAAPVVSGTPSTSYNSGTAITNFSFTSKLFNTTQTANSYRLCEANVALTIFVAPSSNDLSGLESQAANDNMEIISIPSTSPIRIRTPSVSRTGNDLSCFFSISRSSFSGSTIYYRIGKRITKEGEQDPYVFSTTYSYTFPSSTGTSTTGTTGTTATPDLIPVGISRPLYLNMGANLGDGTYTYFKLDEMFCTSLPTLTAYTQDGSLPSTTFASTADKRIMRLNYPLPAMNINFKNNGTAAAGAFQVQVLKPNSSTVLFSANVASLAAGASSSISYNTRGTAVVYRFPGFDGVDDMRFCYVREELNRTLPATIETGGLTIKVDSGSAVNEGTNETNNTRNYTQP
jgi:hypothetical protein